MLQVTISGLVENITNGFNKGHNALTRYIYNMASAFTSLLPQSRTTRSESSRGAVMALRDAQMPANSQIYPGSLHRHQRSIPSATHYRSMLDVDTPSLSPMEFQAQTEESMENWVTEKLDQTSRKHKTENWADILCFYTATNGTAPVAPTRASPAPVPNGKAVSPTFETPQTVSSSDPKIAAQQASDMRNIVRRKLTGYVGFANLPNQWHRKSVRKGFNFNVMVVGMYHPRISWHSPDMFQVNLASASLPW